MRYLNTFVHVPDEDGISHAFGPGDVVPDWALDKIDNPNVWDERAAVAPVVASGDPDDQGEPPVPGEYGEGPFRQRSAAQVRALADAHGLDNTNKDEAIAALEAAGVSPDDETPPLAPTE